MAEELANPPPPAAPPDKVSTALATITSTNSTFTELRAKGMEIAQKFRGVVWDVRTVKGMDEACKARAELREVRYEMQRLRDGGKRMLNDLKGDFDGRAEELIKEVAFAEEPIDAQIKAEEQRKAAEKAERERLEGIRRQRHQDGIASFARAVAGAVSFTSGELRGAIQAVQEVPVDESWEEYQGQAQQAKDEALRQLNGMLVAAQAEESEARELAETKRQQAIVAAQQAARQRELDQEAARQREQQAEAQRKLEAEREELRRQQAELEAQRQRQEHAVRERRAAVQGRIEAIRNTPASVCNATAEVLKSTQDTVAAWPITADLYDDRVEEAEQARMQALDGLAELWAAAVEREKRESADKFARDVQRLIDAWAIPAEWAERSADDLRAVLNGLPVIDPAFYGDRLAEGEGARRAAIQTLSNMIMQAVDREVRQAEAAEERRQQEERQAAAYALTKAKEYYATHLYDALLALVRGMRANDLFSAAQGDNFIAARALICEINPHESFE